MTTISPSRASSSFWSTRGIPLLKYSIHADVSMIIMLGIGSHFFKISFPMDFSAQIPQFFLAVYLNEHFEALFDGGSFCPAAPDLQRPSHQPVVDHDICPHNTPPLCVYNIHIIWIHFKGQNMIVFDQFLMSFAYRAHPSAPAACECSCTHISIPSVCSRMRLNALLREPPPVTATGPGTGSSRLNMDSMRLAMLLCNAYAMSFGFFPLFSRPMISDSANTVHMALMTIPSAPCMAAAPNTSRPYPSLLAMTSRNFPVPAEHLSFISKRATRPFLSNEIILRSCPPMSITVEQSGNRKRAPSACALISVIVGNACFISSRSRPYPVATVGQSAPLERSLSAVSKGLEAASTTSSLIIFWPSSTAIFTVLDPISIPAVTIIL